MPTMSETFLASREVEADLIPDGEYPAKIVDTAVRVANNGAEEVLVIASELNNGEVVKDWLWINSSYSGSREWARKSLAQLCLALDIEELKETEQLHGRHIIVRVSTQRSQAHKPRNRFSYSPVRDEAASSELSGGT